MYERWPAASDRPSTAHGAWLEIDMDALSSNARALRRAIPADTRLGVLVKANGYGHGLEMAARAALDGGADRLIVAALDEALALRRAGLDAPIVVAYPVPPNGVGEAVEARLELTVGGVDSVNRTVAAWSARRQQLADAVLRLHVEIDTGMGRGGVLPAQFADVVQLIDSAPGCELIGVWTHLADGRDRERSAEQIRRFEAVLASLVAAGRQLPLRHVVASEGVFAATAPVYDMVRVGLAYYGELGVGFQPDAAHLALARDLRPAMALKARPLRVDDMPAGASVGYGFEWVAGRHSRVATLPVGYADGWTRAYWPGATALVRGRRVPLIGRVSMDSVCADVTEVPGVTVEDEFVLLGSQGVDSITAVDLAQVRGSIPNEVMCDFGGRLPRLYLRSGRPVAYQLPNSALRHLSAAEE